MRNYASKRAKKGKLAYRTPDRFIPHQISKIKKIKSVFKLREIGVNSIFPLRSSGRPKKGEK